MNRKLSLVCKGRRLTLMTFLLIGVNNSFAKSQYVTFAYAQTKTDFFAEENRQYRPISNAIGYGSELSDSWSFDLSYEKSKGNEEWFSHRALRQSFYESGQSESTAFSVGLTWFPKNHGINISYSSLAYNESSTTYLPFLTETVKSKNNVYLISYIGRWNYPNFDSNNSLESLLNDNGYEWDINWSVGLQSIDANADIVGSLNVNNPINIDIDFNQKSLSAYADLEINYLVYKQSLNYSPYLSLGWNWGLNINGEEYILLSRGEQRVSIEQSGSRFSNQIRVPDSGQYEVGVKFYWGTGKTEISSNDVLDWMMNISYTKSIKSVIEFDTVQIALSVYF